MRDIETILSDIDELVKAKGYIYSLCMLILEDFHYDIEHLHEIEDDNLLGTQEIALLVGYLLHQPIDFSYPNHPTDLLTLKKQSFKLIKELEASLLSYNQKAIIKTQQIKNEYEDEHNNTARLNRLNFFAEDTSIVEPIIYSGDNSLLFQYANFLENKYRADREWLEQHVGFNLEQALSIIEDIIGKLQRKFKRFYSFMVRAKNSEFDAFYENDGAWQAHFYPYMDLFSELGVTKDSPEINKMDDQQWEEFYKNLIELFIIKRADFGEADYVDKFLTTFTTDQLNEYNAQFEHQGDFNYYNDHPILLLKPGSYFIPLSLMLYKALYEAPDRWMLADEAYCKERLTHLSEYNNQVVFHELSKVYFKENIYKNVSVKDEKGQTATIDILCIINNKALIVQTKSNSLSKLGRQSTDKNNLKELQSSIQALYNDGLHQKEILLNSQVQIFTENGVPITLNQAIDEVFTLGVTSGNYPTITHQAHTLIKQKRGEPFPIYTTLFELEIMLYYLKSPFLLLYYLRQRSNLSNYFIATEELAYLGYHLCVGLHPVLDKEFVYISDKYTHYINRNYYPHKYRVDSWVKTENDPIENRWHNGYYDQILKLFKQSSDPNRVDIIFLLMDLRYKSIDRFTQIMMELKEQARADQQQVKNSIFFTADDFGICYIAQPNDNAEELSKALNEFCQIEKYANRATKWIGLGVFENSYKPFNLFYYTDKTWEYDAEIAKKCKRRRFWFTRLEQSLKRVKRKKE